MDDTNDIIVKKQAYDSGTVFNISKLNFGWRELKKSWFINNLDVPKFFILRRIFFKISQYYSRF